MKALVIAVAFLIILLISTGTGQKDEATDLPFSGVTDMVSTVHGSQVWMAAFEGRRLDQWDFKTRRIVNSIHLEDQPVSLLLSEDQKLLLLQGVRNGKLLVFNPVKLIKEKEIYIGQSPVDIAESRQHYIIVRRFPGEIIFIDKKDLSTDKVLSLGREPIALAMVPGKEQLLVAHHLPEMAATDERVACRISVVDTRTKDCMKTIYLTGGSTGVRDIMVSPDGHYAFVSHILARFNLPTTQLERGWMNTNALSVLDLAKLELWTTVLLDDIDQGAANPWKVAFDNNVERIFVTHTGTHEVSIIDWKELKDSIMANIATGTPYRPSENLGLIYPFRKRIRLQGNGPRAMVQVGDQLLIAHYFSDNISMIDLNRLEEVYYSQAKEPITAEKRGEMYFHDASYCFQGWQSCASCHPDARMDGLNWDLLNDGIGNPKNTKSLVHSHATPPVMSLGVRAHATVAVRAGFKYIQFADVPEEYSRDVDAYLESLVPQPAPYLLRNGKRKTESDEGKDCVTCHRGIEVFTAQKCDACHPGPFYTNLKSFSLGSDTLVKWDTPGLNELWRTGPYWHDGRYAALKEVFDIELHGLEKKLSEEDRGALETYLLSL